MRRLYIVSYDIRDEQRLKRVARLLRGYGDRLQYSVHRCDLSDVERAILISKLHPLIDHQKDQVLFIPIGPAGGEVETAIFTLGQPYVPLDHRPIIV